MIEKMFVLIFIVALSLFSSLADYNGIEPTNFHYELAKTKQAQNPSEAKMYVVWEKNNQLQGQIEEMTKSRNQLKAQVARLKQLSKQVDELMQFRLELQKKNNDLTNSLDAATAEAKAAKLENDELKNKLEAKMEEIRGLREQLKQVRGDIEELQSVLKP